MTTSIAFNPMQTTTAAGTFGVQWDGLIVGTAMPDPAVRYALAGGFVATTETLPMWGGLGISEAVPVPQGAPPATPDISLQGALTRATNVLGGSNAGNLTGFTVFDQSHAMINNPSSPVPQALSYMSMNFYRLGSGARVVVPINSTVATYGGDPITQLVSWDYVNQVLVPYQAAFSSNTITAGSWASTGGGQVTFTTNTAHGIAVGGVFVISGVSPSGYNGTYVAIAGTSGSTLVAVLVANPGAYVSGGALAAGGGALSAKLLKVYASGCMAPSYNASTGALTWNYNAAAGIILL